MAAAIRFTVVWPIIDSKLRKTGKKTKGGGGAYSASIEKRVYLPFRLYSEIIMCPSLAG
jgi:hypothetical protein